MKGYKAFNAEWKCREFQYELGKTYELPEGQQLEMCKCGFHFCKNPIDVFGYYDLTDDVLIAEVEALGDIQQEGTKYCTDKIKIVKEFTREQLKALVYDFIFPDYRCPCRCEDEYYNRIPDNDWYCGNAERRTDERFNR